MIGDLLQEIKLREVFYPSEPIEKIIRIVLTEAGHSKHPENVQLRMVILRRVYGIAT